MSIEMRRLASFVLLLLFSLTAARCGTTSPSMTTDFTGNYSGKYQVASCNDGAAAGFCAEEGFNIGQQGPITMSLGQNGVSVYGSMSVSAFSSGSFQGAVNNTTLNGTAPLTPVFYFDEFAYSSTITQWTSTLNGSQMTGSFTVQFSWAGSANSPNLTANLVSFTRQ